MSTKKNRLIRKQAKKSKQSTQKRNKMKDYHQKLADYTLKYLPII